MIPTLPPADDDSPPQPNPEFDISVGATRWRRPARWMAVRRLSVCFKILAPLSAVYCLIMALASLARANQLPQDMTYGYRQSDTLGTAVALFMCLVYILGTVFCFFFWFGLADLLMLFVEMEHNTRQAAARQKRPRMVQED
jgi:hypothetical protein